MILIIPVDKNWLGREIFIKMGFMRYVYTVKKKKKQRTVLLMKNKNLQIIIKKHKENKFASLMWAEIRRNKNE